jgi:hypothetical protein
MDYVPGGTLARRAEQGPLSIDEAAEFAIQIADALNYAHSRPLPIVHRDLKPSNILLDDGRPLLSDFGIAYVVGSGPRLTRTGDSLGTPEYMSPEQSEGLAVDGRTDIYSLGVILYQLVTGRLPFQAKTPIATMHQVVYDRPLAPRECKADVPEWMESIILRAMAKSPADRFATAGEMAEALRNRRVVQVAASETQQTGATAVVRQQGEGLPPRYAEQRAGVGAGRRSRRGLKLALLVAGALAALGVAAFLVAPAFLGRTAAGQPPARAAAAPTTPPANSPAGAPAPSAPTPSPSAGPTATGGPAVAPPVPTPLRVGHITFRLANGHVYLVAAQANAVPQDLSKALDALAPGSTDDWLNISADGAWLLVGTDRSFDPECANWPCLVLVKGDLSAGSAVRANGAVVHDSGFAAVASGGNLIVYPAPGGPHTMDLWAIRRAGADWSAPLLLTGRSHYAYNYRPALAPDGTQVLFDCGDQAEAGEGTAVCEARTDGRGMGVVLTPAESPNGLPKIGALDSPSYGPSGSIIFEADWPGAYLWRLAGGIKTPVKVAPQFDNDRSPCVLPGGPIASLWRGRPGNTSHMHELKVMSRGGDSFVMVLSGQDVQDAGLGCGW